MNELLGASETFLGSRGNEKIAQFYVAVKKRTEVVSHPPNRHHGKERARGEKGGAGTPRDVSYR
ncbi:UNVERIFIED_CONTAM: hypothetical protein NCL1_28416 [Trichonephila clavipes]